MYKYNFLKSVFSLLTLLSSFSISTNLFAQNPTFEWAQQMGGTSLERGYSIAVDGNGNVFATGFFRETVDFDPGSGTMNLTSNGESDIFIQKLDPNGNLIWATSIGGSGSDEGKSISTDQNGDIYITGTFENTVDFDSGSGTQNLTSNGELDVFILKLDNNGNFIWAKSIGGSDSDISYKINIDPFDNVYIVGSCLGIIDFDPGVGVINAGSNFTDANGFILKLDANGNYSWTNTITSDRDDLIRSVTTDKNGNVYTIGSFQRTINPFVTNIGLVTLTANGYSDIFVQKHDQNGNRIWIRQIGSMHSETGNDIAVDSKENVYSTGFFRNVVDFDPGSSETYVISNGQSDAFVHKMDINGNLIWVKQIGGTSPDEGRAITVDEFDNVYTTGVFDGTVDFNPGPGVASFNSSSGELFIQKLNADGNFRWAVQFGGSFVNESFSITSDNFGNIYTTGSFLGTGDFNPGQDSLNLTSNGVFDIFIHKLSQCQTRTTDQQVACGSYRWIDGNQYTASNNTAQQVFVSSTGCDSIVTLDLTINPALDVSIVSNGTTISANNINGTYQWIDCSKNSAIPGETASSYTTTTTGRYAVEITENGCIDTSDCILVSVVGLNDLHATNPFNLYPNPTEGAITIQFEKAPSEFEVIITDSKGQLVSRKQFQQESLVVFEVNQPAGVYFITIQTPEESRTVKTIVK